MDAFDYNQNMQNTTKLWNELTADSQEELAACVGWYLHTLARSNPRVKNYDLSVCNTIAMIGAAWIARAEFKDAVPVVFKNDTYDWDGENL